MEDFYYADLPEHYMDLFKLYDPVGGEHFNIFAAGLKTTNIMATVSHGYVCKLKPLKGGWDLLMPSRFKLCGLRDIVQPFNPIEE